jgi:hypothetical protein
VSFYKLLIATRQLSCTCERAGTEIPDAVKARIS